MRWGGGGCPMACGLLVSSALAAGVEIDELDERRFVELNSLPCGDFLQRGVDVRQMMGSDVAHEGARDFVVAHATMQPAQEDYELHRDGNKCCEPAGRGGRAQTVDRHAQHPLRDAALSSICLECGGLACLPQAGRRFCDRPLKEEPCSWRTACESDLASKAVASYRTPN